MQCGRLDLEEDVLGSKSAGKPFRKSGKQYSMVFMECFGCAGKRAFRGCTDRT